MNRTWMAWALGGLFLLVLAALIFILKPSVSFKLDTHNSTSSVSSTPQISADLRKECDLSTQESRNRSEHVLLQEVFWNDKLGECFIIAWRPLPAASDWATDYAEKNRLVWMTEGGYFTLLSLNRSTPVLAETYSYRNLNDYLADPNKDTGEWKAEFYRRVEEYR